MGNKKILYKNFLWQYGERIAVQGFSFLVTILLARLLLPEEYGIISIASIFITLLEVFVTSGLGNALIQKVESDELDFSSVFYFNILLSCILYLILFLLAPYIAIFYKNSILTLIIRLMALRVIFGAYNTIQIAYVQKKMKFKLIFYSSLFSTFVASILSIYFAFKGFGVYALIIQYLSNAFLSTLIMFFLIPWKPKLIFSWVRLKVLLAFGSNLLLSAFLNTIFSEVKSFILGKKYTMSDLAFYDKGRQFPSLVYDNINTSISKVLFPIMANYQYDRVVLKKMMSKSMQVMAFILFPILCFMIGTAEYIIELLLTEKWLGAVPFLRIACVTYLFVLINTVFTNAINSVGRSDLHLKVEILNIVVGLIVLLLLMNRGAIYIALSITVSSLFCALYRFIIISKILNYSFLDFLIDIYKPVLFSFIMLIGLLYLNDIFSSLIFNFLFLFVVSSLFYFLASWLFNRSVFEYIYTRN